MRKAIF